MSEVPRGPMHSGVKMHEHSLDSRMAAYVRTHFGV
jgi:hypothetical protein